MKPIARNPGSFRDPAGFVFECDGEIFRSVTARAIDDLRSFLDSDRFRRLRDQGAIVETTRVDPRTLTLSVPSAVEIVRHERVPFISYPYEWPFELLKSAALFHLQVQIDALKDGFSLSDASAYNIQFRGPRPVFIDVLSFRRYREGEVWTGQRQFNQQFLNPLLLQSVVGVPYHDWYRGAPDGITSTALARLIPWRKRFGPSILAHVLAPARIDRKVARDGQAAAHVARGARLSKANYLGLLRQLHQWIGELETGDRDRTTWQDYDVTNSYVDRERQAKRAFVQSFCERAKPQRIVDIGCNTGDYAQAALESGARSAIGLDFDHGALRNAWRRTVEQNLDFLPLYQDTANPSPGLGWRGMERPGIRERARFDAVLGLAVEHHLAIARNIPLDQVVDWLVDWAPQGVLEFVPKSDPTVQTMLALREDVFDDYSQQGFETALTARARIVRSEMVSSTGRVLYAFDRT